MLEKFQKLGVAVAGVSKDSLKSHAKFSEGYDLKMPLLSDPDLSAIKAYGAYGPKSGSKSGEGVIRSTVVVGADGKVLKAYYGVKSKGHAEEVFKDMSQ